MRKLSKSTTVIIGLLCVVALLSTTLAVVYFTETHYWSMRLMGDWTLEFYEDAGLTTLLPEIIDMGDFSDGQSKQKEFWIKDVGTISANVSFIKTPVLADGFAFAIDYWDGSVWTRWHATNNPDGDVTTWYMDSEWLAEAPSDVLRCRFNVVEVDATPMTPYTITTDFNNNGMA